MNSLKTNDQVNPDAASDVPLQKPNSASLVQLLVRFLRFIQPVWPVLGLGLAQLLAVGLLSVFLGFALPLVLKPAVEFLMSLLPNR
jgi:hypothetical protein